MSQHDPSSPMGAPDPSPTPSDAPRAAARGTRGAGAARSIVPGLTLFCVNLTLGAFLVAGHVWPQSLGLRSSSPSAPAAPGPVATATFSADPIESPPAQETPVTIVLTPAPVTPTAASVQRAQATPIPTPTATATPTPATPTSTPSHPTPTPTLQSVG